MKEELLRVDNPYTGEIVLERTLLRAEEIDPLMSRANKAHLEWRATPIAARVELVQRFIKEFEKERERYAKEITEEMGKPISQANNEINGMFERARQMASIAEASLAHEQ